MEKNVLAGQSKVWIIDYSPMKNKLKTGQKQLYIQGIFKINSLF